MFGAKQPFADDLKLSGIEFVDVSVTTIELPCGAAKGAKSTFGLELSWQQTLSI